MTMTPADVDEYLATIPEEPRAALQQLRRAIKSAAPKAVETISYKMPTFKYDGRLLVSFAAFKDHCSLFPIGPTIIEAHTKELEGYAAAAGKGTLRFSASKPLPSALVRKLVKARIAEIDARASATLRARS